MHYKKLQLITTDTKRHQSYSSCYTADRVPDMNKRMAEWQHEYEYEMYMRLMPMQLELDALADKQNKE